MWMSVSNVLASNLILAVLLFGLLAPNAVAENDTVEVSIYAVNPSKTDSLNSVIRQPLPVEIREGDVMDNAGMDVKFDEGKKEYYVENKVALLPGETKKFIIILKNIWTLSAQELGEIRQQLEENFTSLKGTKYEPPGQLLYEKVSQELSQLETSQAQEMPIKKRIELYRANVKRLDSLRDEIYSLETLRKLSGETSGGERTVKFRIDAENPADTAKTMTVRSSIPKEIQPSDVIDLAGFSLLFDSNLNRFIVEKADEFQASEAKTYYIVLRDVWYIDPLDLSFIKEQTQKVMEHFSESEYEAFAEKIGAYINNTIDSIVALQEEVASSESVGDRSRAYILNQERYQMAKAKLKELQDLMLELPLKKEEAEKDKIRRAVRQLVKIADVIAVGFEPDKTTTWWIILGVIGIVFLLGTIFYFSFLSQLNKSKFGKGKNVKTNQESKAAA